MAGRKKGAVRKGHGTMCNICGKNCGKGGALRTHVEGAHGVGYEDYKRCFYGYASNVITDAWNDEVKTKLGDPVLIHVLVRRFVEDPGTRGATKIARKPASLGDAKRKKK